MSQNLMRIFTSLFFLTALSFLMQPTVYSQNCSGLNIQWQADISSTCNQMVVTMIHDQLNRPYLYVANKEAGLTIYDISTLTAPSIAASVPITSFGGLEVMNLYQDGNYVYLALGNSFTNPQQGGLGIVDVTNPATPKVTHFYIVPSSATGGGIVKVEGNYAYLGAMESGLVILDVTLKANIKFVSQFIPAITFPPIKNPNPNLYNARGMDVKNSIVYLCYDGGGIRIINCTNKNIPVETGRWCNPAMYTPVNHPKAYNNCVLDDTLLYVAVDYAGMEILNVSDTSNITLLGWWNPYNSPSNNWFNTPSHANEIQYEKNCKRIFLSTGKSDMQVVDVTNPALPDSCNFYGGVSNSIGTWGIGIWQNQIYLSYICAFIPFSSNWTGVKILTHNSCITGTTNQLTETASSIFPNPFTTQTTIQTEENIINGTLVVYNSLGEAVKEINNISGRTITFHRNNLSSGLYYIQIRQADKTMATSRFLITD